MIEKYRIRLETTTCDYIANQLLNQGYDLHTVGFNSAGEPTYIFIYKRLIEKCSEEES